jgi:predicted RND superfamily exporter protein
MWTAPLLATINLVVGIMWTIGFVALTIGRLNLFTFMFAVILIGLGIDFAIHMNAAFSTARGEGKSLGDCLKEMYRRAGPGVVTGALTTAAAFLALVFTGLDALVELGVVLGAGILLTLLASLVLLPAMYAINFRVGIWLQGEKPRPPKQSFLPFKFLGALGGAIQRRPWPVLLVLLGVTCALGVAAKNAGFEPDMLEIEPPEMPSVTLHREVLEKYELHPDYAMVTSDDFDKTRTMVKKLKKNRLVGRVDAITELLPSAKEQKRRGRIVRRIGARMNEILSPAVVQSTPKKTSTKVELNQIFKELDRLQMNVQEIGQLAFASMKLRLQRTCDRLTGGEDAALSVILRLKKRFEKMADLGVRVAEYERIYIPSLAGKLRKMANERPITIDTLPDAIKDRYMSSEGMNLVTVYAAVDLWHEGKTALFLNATKKASDRVTGAAVLTDRLITLIGEKGLMAVFLALGAVFVILLVDFRKFGYAVLGALPLVFGFVWMVGLFVILGRKFDVVNVTALPLILGIGVDDAVHVLHAIRRRGRDAMPEVLRHTGRALLLTSLTTGIAFYAIAVSSHRGMAGMGMLLVLGVAACFVTSVTLLPALVRIFFKDKTSQHRVSDQKEEGDVQN